MPSKDDFFEIDNIKVEIIFNVQDRIKKNTYSNEIPTSGSVRIVRSCFLDVTTILSLLSLLFSVYQCYQEQDLVA